MAAAEKLTKVKQPPKKNAAEAAALAKLDKELQTQLAYLRQSSKEIARIYADNLGHDLLELADAVRELARKHGGGKGTRRTLEQLISITDKVALKPVKGRKKDLSRIERAVARMDRLIER
jgi:hypothetical protein